MDETFDRDKSAYEVKDDATQYLDCVRLVESGNLRRFQQFASTFDLVRYESNEGENRPSKSLLFYAIEHNDEPFVHLLLNMEVPLEKTYSVMITDPSSSTGDLSQKTLTAADFARVLNRHSLAELIDQHARLAPHSQRFYRVLQTNDIRRCDTFIRHLNNDEREEELAVEGFFHAARLGSVRLLDYFLSRWKIDVNIEREDENHNRTTALSTAITANQNEAAKFLLFRQADPNLKGRYDNALVTALHYNSSNDLIRLLLEKNVDMTARHPDYPKLTLREYCVLTNRVQAKKQLDDYIVRLIIQGNHERLKWLVDHGYPHISLNITSKRNTRQLATERYYENIVKLINFVEERQHRAKLKMNF